MGEPVSDVVGALKSVDRRNERRFEGGLSSNFTMSDGLSVRVIPCKIESLSASAMRIVTDEVVPLMQPVWIDLEGFGPIRATVEAVREDGFICQNVLNEPARRRLNVWVAWLTRVRRGVDADKRSFLRTRPHDSRTTVAFEDGQVIAVRLQNISRSGAAVLSDHVALPGTPVMVGRVPGKVVRTFTGGFAVSFDRVLETTETDWLVSGYQVKALPLTSAG
jgi:hypothetical protein